MTGGDIVNLRRERKRRRRTEQDKQASRNRLLSSMPGRERRAEAEMQKQVELRHECHRLDRPGAE